MFSFLKIKHMAEFGDGLSQFLLGFLYDHGVMTDRDPIAARHWYELAAKQGIVLGEYALFLNLIAVDKERDVAMAWLKKAANSAFVAAETELGAHYHLSPDEKNSDELAVQWTRLAAEKGYLPALHRLASFYEKGLHVRRDPKKAEAYFREGAQRGDPNCAFSLGSMLLEEDGPKKRTAEGLRWIHEAAKQGHANACGSLSLIYSFGQHGVTRNRELAEIFLRWSEEAIRRPMY